MGHQVIIFSSISSNEIFGRKNQAKFKKEVRPGDRLVYEVKITQSRGTVVKVDSIAKVEGKVAAKAELLLGVKK